MANQSPASNAAGRLEYAAPMSQAPTLPGTVIDKEALTRLIPPFRVILHNDDHNSMDHVVLSLMRCVPSLDFEAATEIMFIAHHHGEATVIECPKEAAEHYRDALESSGLTATIEPA
ncbi:MAG: ATP-dependent Clp protease adaptor ClpS [Tepidiformaceae bacterium]